MMGKRVEYDDLYVVRSMVEWEALLFPDKFERELEEEVDDGEGCEGVVE